MGKSHSGCSEERRTAICIRENGKQIYSYERIEKTETGNGIISILHNETGEKPSWFTRDMLPL